MLKSLVLSLFILSLTQGLPLEEELIDEPILVEDDFGVSQFNDTSGNLIPQPRYAQLSIDDKTYTFFFQPVNWHAALELCSSQNQVIGSVANSDENTKLINTLAQYGLLHSDSSFWLGASDLSHSGKWSWIKNGRPALFTNWRAGEPNNANGNEHCLELQSNGQWNDLNCDQARQVICESHPYCTSYNPIYG